MAGRIEPLADRVLDLDALALEERQQLAPDQLHALPQRRLAPGALERAVQVVEGRHQSLEDGRRGVDVRLLAVPLHPLAVVLELGGLAQELVPQLLVLAAQGLELFSVGGR